MRRTARLLLATVIALLPMHFAIPAQAHADLVGVQVGPGMSVRLTFTEDMRALGTTVVVLDPRGQAVHDGDPVVKGSVVEVRLLPAIVVGDYRINFRVLSADGHVVSGSETFTIDTVTPLGDDPAPVSTASATPALPVSDARWAYGVTALLMAVVAAAASMAWRSRR